MRHNMNSRDGGRQQSTGDKLAAREARAVRYDRRDRLDHVRNNEALDSLDIPDELACHLMSVKIR